MIWALLAAYFLTGGSISGSMVTSATAKALIQQSEIVIEDPVRAKSVKQTLVKLKKEAKQFQKLYTKSGKQLNKSYKDHSADLNQTIAILDELNSEWISAQQSTIDLRFELREATTEKEWTKLFSGEEHQKN